MKERKNENAAKHQNNITLARGIGGPDGGKVRSFGRAREDVGRDGSSRLMALFTSASKSGRRRLNGKQGWMGYPPHLRMFAQDY